jgi:hypothetical protein
VNGFHNNITVEIPIILGNVAIDVSLRKQATITIGRQGKLNEKSPLVANHKTIDQDVSPFAPQQEITMFQIIFFSSFFVFIFNSCNMVFQL